MLGGISALHRWTAYLTVERPWAIRLPLSRLVTLLADEFIEAGVDRAFVCADGVFADKNLF